MLYSCNGLAKDRSHKGNREHMIRTFEQAMRLMPPGVERWVWFADMHGFAMRDLQPVRTLFCIFLVQMLVAAIGPCFWPSQPCSTLHGFVEQDTARKAVAGLQIDQCHRLFTIKASAVLQGIAQSFLDLLGKHYPERLQTFYLVDAPAMFSMLWSTILPLVDHATRAKVKFLPYVLHSAGVALQLSKLPRGNAERTTFASFTQHQQCASVCKVWLAVVSKFVSD